MDTADRDPGRCPHCGAALEVRGEATGERPYWACPADHTPPVVLLPPRNVGYAMALVRGRLHDPIREEDYLQAFDAEAPDPARFVERVCQRLALVATSVRETNADQTGRPSREADDHDADQSNLREWSA